MVRIDLRVTSIFRIHWIVIHTAFLLVVMSSYTWASSELDRLREAEVIKAREGRLEESIATLEKYRIEHPQNIPLLSDLIVLYGWSGAHDKVVELFSQDPSQTFPDYVHPTVLRSYRELGQSDKALELVNFQIQRGSEDEGLLLTKIQLLVDLGEYEEAHRLLDSLEDKDDTNSDRSRVAGYLYSAQGEWLRALRQYQGILARNPGDPEAIVGQVKALLNLGAPHAAEKHATAHAELIDLVTKVNILRAKAALMLRWSSHAYDKVTEDLKLTASALTLHLIALDMLPPDQHYDDLRRLIEYDMVVAFSYLRHLYKEGYALYQLLLEEGDVPPYVTQAGAQSLLGLRRPEEAIPLLEKVLEADPDNYEALLILFYALIENERFNEAYDLVERRIARTPKFKTFPDSPTQYRNDERLDLEIIAAQARLYGDQLSDAWERISILRDAAPANNWLVNVAGEIAMARDWPRQAYTYFQTAHLLNPDTLSALEGKGQSLIRRHRYNEAKKILDHLKNRHPFETATQRLEHDLYWAQRPDLWADLELSYSEGPEQSGDGIVATGELISSPLNQHLHISFQGRYSWSEIPEGEVSLTRYGGGVEFIKESYSLLALLNYNDSTIDETGGVLRGTWTPDDHWYLSLQGDRFSDATPLRALYYGIWQDRVSGSIGYRWHESTSLMATFNYGLFTDDNQRYEGGLTYTGRMIDIPRFDFDGIIELYGSSNSRDDAPYYNPAADFKIRGVLKGEHILYRFYESSLVHQLSAGVGVYAQQDYDTGPVGSLRYELRYNYNPLIEARLGGEIGQNRYDGEDEPYYKFNLMIHAKF